MARSQLVDDGFWELVKRLLGITPRSTHRAPESVTGQSVHGDHVLWSCTLGSAPSVSKARKRSLTDWVFWDSRIGVGTRVQKRERCASGHC
jgi:hypothetical protein